MLQRHCSLFRDGRRRAIKTSFSCAQLGGRSDGGVGGIGIGGRGLRHGNKRTHLNVIFISYLRNLGISSNIFEIKFDFFFL